jgi:hypothetical protein
MNWNQTLTLGALLIAVVGGQAFWVAREIDALRREIDTLRREIGLLRDEMRAGFDRITAQLDRVVARLNVEADVIRDHGERIARLEERAS